jgi:CheY-like chemotaxis protein
MSGVIVCIDDEPAICRILGSVLRETGASVETFTDPHEALRFIRDNDVAAVVCDHRMPALSGLEVLERMEKCIPFLVVSGDLDAAELTGRVPGVTAVLPKPFHPARLLELARLHMQGGG